MVSRHVDSKEMQFTFSKPISSSIPPATSRAALWTAARARAPGPQMIWVAPGTSGFASITLLWFVTDSQGVPDDVRGLGGEGKSGESTDGGGEEIRALRLGLVLPGSAGPRRRQPPARGVHGVCRGGGEDQRAGGRGGGTGGAGHASHREETARVWGDEHFTKYGGRRGVAPMGACRPVRPVRPVAPVRPTPLHRVHRGSPPLWPKLVRDTH
eukprot:gene2352-biopygen14061